MQLSKGSLDPGWASIQVAPAAEFVPGSLSTKRNQAQFELYNRELEFQSVLSCNEDKRYSPLVVRM